MLDLVVTNLFESAASNVFPKTMSVLLGNGDGTFQAHFDYEVGTTGELIVVGDFNRDGSPDVAIAGGLSANVSVLLGNGDGTFTAPAVYPAGQDDNSLAIGDFNGDGFLDLAVANGSGDDGGSFGSVSVLLGQGNGTFGSQSEIGLETGLSWVVVADFNQDGKADLGVGDPDNNKVGVLLGNGDATFRPQVSYIVGNNPGSIAAGDLTGNGVSSLVSANFVDQTVSVLLNLACPVRASPPDGGAVGGQHVTPVGPG